MTASLSTTDEMYASQKVIPTHVYSPIGEKGVLTNRLETKSWKQNSLIQSIASNGSKYHEIVQGTVNRSRFQEYVEHLPYPEGTYILLDNCQIHKKLNETFEQRGYIPVFLPPYSPEFQPVEFAFFKNQRLFQTGASCADRGKKAFINA